MIPWQKVNRSCLAELEQHYLGHEPYCHLNIVDLWSYRVGLNQWFKVGDTIVYRLNDYVNDSLYLTILGQKSVKEALQELSNKFKSQKTITLKCVPETTLKTLGNWDAIISIEEDMNYHDYIYDVETIINFSSGPLKQKQKSYNKLVKNHPGLHFKALDNHKKSDRNIIYSVFKKWARQTGSDDWQKEYLALKRALNLSGVQLVCVGFFDRNKMIGYTVNGPEKSGYYQAFFGKADRRYKGLSIYQERETAKYMFEKHGSKFMNLQPDCGIEGLRQYKNSLGPIKMLKKYMVVISTTQTM